MARQPDLARELRGPRIFQLLDPADREHVSQDVIDDIAVQLSAQLGQPATGKAEE